MKFPGITCDCGEAELISVAPGSEPTYGQSRDMFDQPSACCRRSWWTPGNLPGAGVCAAGP